MKIVCTQENLKIGVMVVGRIISSSSTLPILSNILLKTENGVLKISSTNLEIAITTQVRCKVEEEGEITVSSKTITELVSNLPNKNITLETQNNNELKIETDNYHTTIKTLSADDFPLIPKVENGKTIQVEAQTLKEAVDQVVFAASNNQTQPEISGVLFAKDTNALRVVATDRYRLAEKKINLQNTETSTYEVIIPQKTLQELSRIIGGQKELVEIHFSENQISLSLNDTQIISRLVDGQYPDYRQIIPGEFKTKITTPKQSLQNALKTTSVFSQGTNSVSFNFSPEKQTLSLFTESSELGRSDIDIPSVVEGIEGKVILNNRYVQDCLAGMDTEKMEIKVIDDNSPSVMVPEGKTDYLYLVMPIKS